MVASRLHNFCFATRNPLTRGMSSSVTGGPSPAACVADILSTSTLASPLLIGFSPPVTELTVEELAQP